MIKKILLLSTALLFVVFLSSGQTMVYDVVKGSKTIGSVTVEISRDKGQVKYKINSDVNFRILFSFNVKYQMEEKFYGDRLTWGKAFNTLNGRIQKESEIFSQDDDTYKIVLDGIASITDKKHISYSVSKLYSQEPVNETAVFSQSFGRYLPLTKVSENSYELDSPDGVNVYTYENGICKEVKVSRDFANFYFRIQEESFARATETK